MAKLPEQEIRRRLRALKGWKYEANRLLRRLSFRSYMAEVAFFNVIALIAEELDHHPDVSLSWGKMELSLSTHSEGGVTEKDFELAERIEGAYSLIAPRRRRAS
jgi:4a-hydroxytetrahydrobiopterin dehydratase